MLNETMQAQLSLGTGLLITLLSAFVVAALVFLMLAALNLLRSHERLSRTAHELALEALKDRLQRGEIDREQYRTLRAQLESG
jgi:uncharacterized membrane protein